MIDRDNLHEHTHGNCDNPNHDHKHGKPESDDEDNWDDEEEKIMRDIREQRMQQMKNNFQ